MPTWLFDVLTRIIIARPPEVVSAYAGDPSNAPRWYVNIGSVEWQTPPPLAIGSRVNFTAGFLGRNLCYSYEVVDLVPHQRLVMRTAQGPFPMETTYTWEPAETASTLMTLRNRGEPAGFASITGQVMSVAMKRANHKDLARLRTILEAA